MLGKNSRNLSPSFNANHDFHCHFSDALQSIVTALYCKILVILGLALPLAEVISVNVPQGYYQLFYVYLFLGSLLFLFGIHIDLIRTRY